MVGLRRIYLAGPFLAGCDETMKRLAERSGQHYRGIGPLIFRDVRRGAHWELRRRVKPSLYYDLVADADKDPEYAEQRDYIARVDLVIFVVDSQRERLEAGIHMLETLQAALAGLGRAPEWVPMVFQLNKRDLPGVLPESELRPVFRTPRCAHVATSARHGHGIDDLITSCASMLEAS